MRANEKSYVCDVNGFSFVKNSQKYYDDFAKVLGNIILRELAPYWLTQVVLDPLDIPIVPPVLGQLIQHSSR